MSQPMPTKNDSVPIADLVIAAIEKRKEKGVVTYGTLLQKFNGRNSVYDAFEEILDMACYTQQWLQEREEIVSFLREVANTDTGTGEYLEDKARDLLEKMGEERR